MELLKAYIFGLTLSLTVGPMTLLIVQRAISKGLKSAMLTSLGLALADWTWALIAFSIGAYVLVLVSEYQALVKIFSGIVLLCLGAYIFWSSLVAFKGHKALKAANTSGGDFISAYLLTLHNPLTIAIFLSFIGHTNELQSVFSVILYANMVLLGSATGQFTVALISYNLRRFFKSPKTIFLMNTVSSIIIGIFGILSFIKI